MIIKKEKIPPTVYFILGADDPEMQRIEEILKETSISYGYALYEGERVHAGNAYQATSFSLGEDVENFSYITIECSLEKITPIKRIDHHREGDYGYDKTHKQYFEASSLGQLITHLSLTPTHKDHVIAAMDHSFSSAYEGLCHPVTQEDVKKIIPKEQMELSKKYIQLLQSAKKVSIGNRPVTHLKESVGVVYSLEYLSARLAAILIGEPVILTTHHGDGIEKIHLCGGNVAEEVVIDFMERWARENNLQNIYGVPKRGYAGGYNKL